MKRAAKILFYWTLASIPLGMAVSSWLKQQREYAEMRAERARWGW